MGSNRLKFVLTAFLFLGFSVWAQSPEEVISVELITDQTEVTSGTQGWLGIKVKLAPEWHIYWKNSGESGYPTTLTWDAPSEIEIEPLEYPAPHLYTYDGLSGYILKDEFYLLAPFKISFTFPCSSF